MAEDVILRRDIFFFLFFFLISDIPLSGSRNRVSHQSSSSWRSEFLVGDRWLYFSPPEHQFRRRKATQSVRVQNRTHAECRRRYQRLVSKPKKKIHVFFIQS